MCAVSAQSIWRHYSAKAKIYPVKDYTWKICFLMLWIIQQDSLTVLPCNEVGTPYFTYPKEIKCFLKGRKLYRTRAMRWKVLSASKSYRFDSDCHCLVCLNVTRAERNWHSEEFCIWKIRAMMISWKLVWTWVFAKLHLSCRIASRCCEPFRFICE